MRADKLDFRLLGPLEVWAGGEPLPLGGAKQRATLAVLLLHANEPVSPDRLIDALWGERPPETARTALQGYVTQLRRLLEPSRKKRAAGEVLVTTPAGYVLQVADGAVDRDRFEALAAKGHAALAAGRPAQAAELCRSALELWRGPALAEFAYDTWAQTAAERLAELRLVSLEERIEAELELGHHAELVGELEALVAEQPLRERPRALLMLALYRAGRQAEALEAYQAARRALVDELGIDPSPELRELQAAILRQDAGLDVSAPPARPPTNLPAPATPLIGRERELAEAGALLAREDVRSAHPHRRRRVGQDTPGACPRRAARRELPPRSVFRAARSRLGSRPPPADGRRRAGRIGRAGVCPWRVPGRCPRGLGAPACARQPRAVARSRAGPGRPNRSLPAPHRPRHEPRAAPARRGAGVRCTAARRGRRGGALPGARTRARLRAGRRSGGRARRRPSARRLAARP